jgi:hypothetical protein
MERPKLELELNQPKTIKLLFDEAIVGESQYGKYYLYAVSNGSDKEYSFFAPEEVHAILKDCKKGTIANITKVASQKGSKLVTSYNVEVEKESVESGDDLVDSAMLNQNKYLDMMIQSFEDALIIQEKFNGMANVNQIAITMFIQRTKSNN